MHKSLDWITSVTRDFVYLYTLIALTTVPWLVAVWLFQGRELVSAFGDHWYMLVVVGLIALPGAFVYRTADKYTP